MSRAGAYPGFLEGGGAEISSKRANKPNKRATEFGWVESWVVSLAGGGGGGGGGVEDPLAPPPGTPLQRVELMQSSVPLNRASEAVL